MHVPRLALGLLTVVPVVWFFTALGVLVVSVITRGVAQEDLILPRELLFVGHVVAALLSLCLLVFYLRHAFRNPRLSKDARALWAVLIVVANVFVMPAYWWLYLRKGSVG